jgi:hypothetical protein
MANGRPPPSLLPPGLVAEPDQKSIQVVALGDRVPPHTRRSVRYEVTSQEPVQEDIALQNGERSTWASVMTVTEAEHHRGHGGGQGAVRA